LLILHQWVQVALAENASVLYGSESRGEQEALTWTGVNEQDFAADMNYLKFSLKHELQKRLSSKARIFLEGEEEFKTLDARYTNYKRPWYIAAIQVTEEADVVETVGLLIEKLDAILTLQGKLCPIKRYPICCTIRRSFSDNIPATYKKCHCD
jgi:hypothetical protein